MFIGLLQSFTQRQLLVGLRARHPRVPLSLSLLCRCYRQTAGTILIYSQELVPRQSIANMQSTVRSLGFKCQKLQLRLKKDFIAYQSLAGDFQHHRVTWG